MTKFSYSQNLGKYVVTELGKLIDSDDNFDALLTRHGMLSDDDLAHQPAIEVRGHEDQIFDFSTAISDADDDLAVIREFLED
jgi:hypothetical protein